MTSDSYEAWLGVFLAFAATFFWRLLGLLLAQKVSTDGAIIRWINAITYSMVAGVLMLILVYPTGILSTTSLSVRLLALFAGAVAIYFTKKLPISIAIGMTVFALSVTFKDSFDLLTK